MFSMEMMQKVAKLAKQRRITQGELARMIGAAPARLSEWKRGTGKPSLDQAFRMSRALGVPLDFLADDAAEAFPAAVSPEERSLLTVFHASKLTLEEAVTRLYPAPRETDARKPKRG